VCEVVSETGEVCKGSSPEPEGAGQPPGERCDAGGGLTPAYHLRAVGVPGGQVGQGAAAPLVVLDAHGAGLGGGKVGWQRQRAWMEVSLSAQMTQSPRP
jgi:hypothetical protein